METFDVNFVQCRIFDLNIFHFIFSYPSKLKYGFVIF